jgi:STE24 endopeptidase
MNERGMNVRRLVTILSVASAGYAAWRWFETARELRTPSPRAPKDAAAYGRGKRALALVSIARGTAGAAALAYGIPGERLSTLADRAPVWLQPAIFATLAQGASDALDTGTAFVEDYATERRYGLSEQNPGAWAIDHAKGTGIGLALTAVAATLFGAVVRKAPRAWPLIAGAASLPLFILANVLVPVYVLPLFNTFEPLEGPLEQRLRRLATRFGVGDAEILRMDMSKQTKKANAFVTGIGRTHRIVIGDTLLATFSDDETEFVVAHELGHYVAKDTWRTTFVGAGLITTLFFFANAMARRNDCGQSQGIARLYFWITIGSQISRPALFAFSRSREWAADRFAIEALHASQAGAAAFRRLRDQNLAEDEQPAWYEFLFGSHPSLKKRIAALEAATA